MNMRILLSLLGLVGLCVAGCATQPGAKEVAAADTATRAKALETLGKNLRQAYPPLNSYFETSADLGSLKVFASIDDDGYSCRVFTLAKGKTHVGQVADSSPLAPPTLTEMSFTKDHDIKVRFSEVARIQANPSPPPAGGGADFPAFTDLCLQDERGEALDTITASTASTNQVVSALVALCPHLK